MLIYKYFVFLRVPRVPFRPTNRLTFKFSLKPFRQRASAKLRPEQKQKPSRIGSKSRSKPIPARN